MWPGLLKCWIMVHLQLIYFFCYLQKDNLPPGVTTWGENHSVLYPHSRQVIILWILTRNVWMALSILHAQKTITFAISIIESLVFALGLNMSEFIWFLTTYNSQYIRNNWLLYLRLDMMLSIFTIYSCPFRIRSSSIYSCPCHIFLSM